RRFGRSGQGRAAGNACRLTATGPTRPSHRERLSMALDDDDLRLDRPHQPPPNPFESEYEERSPLRWVVVGLACIVAVGLLAYWWMSRSQPTTPTAATPAASEPVADIGPIPEPLALPPLEESDAFIRNLVSLLSNNPTLARLLASPTIVRSTTLGVIQ